MAFLRYPVFVVNICLPEYKEKKEVSRSIGLMLTSFKMMAEKKWLSSKVTILLENSK